MKKCLVVCLLAMPLIMQGADNRGSGKQGFLSKSDLGLGQSTKAQPEAPLSHSAPDIPRSPYMTIPGQKQYKGASPSSFDDLVIGSPDKYNLLTFTAANKAFDRRRRESFGSNIPK